MGLHGSIEVLITHYCMQTEKQKLVYQKEQVSIFFFLKWYLYLIFFNFILYIYLLLIF